MRAVVQRVSSARVRVDGRMVGEIGCGLLVYAGVENEDGPSDVAYVGGKIRDLRIFDEAGKMNRSVGEAKGGILLVSQFTLCGDCRRGRRPSFDGAAPPAVARPLYEDLVRQLRESGLKVETGEFQARMHVDSVNDGPVTILLDSRRRL
jgi:D-aminoacyl-tRNA deacylase